MAGDVDLLLSFKNSLPNPNPNVLSNWNHKHEVCEFQGVTCKGGRVSALTIRGLPLGADFSSVSAHILPLENLETLALCSTNLTGSISPLPTECASKLTELNLSNNNLRGSALDATSLAVTCHSLQLLNLSNNYIGQWFNHSSLEFLPRIKVLDVSHNMIAANEDLHWLFSTLNLVTHLNLSNNNIQGTMPQINNCTSLQYLDLSSNELSDTIPAGTFSGCINLSYLNLSFNHFTGKVPSDINACASLITISLSNNNFSGEIPVLPGLQFLDLAFNNFDGHLSNSISELKSLEILDLSANKFSGSIPDSLCTYNLSNLKVLYLQDNYFSSTIPYSLSNCTNLVSLDLSLNFLSGTIPSSLGSLSKLRDMIMWQNNLQGEIPVELSCLTSLRNLLLDNNGLTGSIPDGLLNCTELNWFSLASNQLTGSIPISIGKLEKLVILVLRNNSFTGSIPPGLGDCKGLLYLDLSSNQLSGSIPPTLAKQSGKIIGDFIIRDWPYFTLSISDSKLCHRLVIFLEFNEIRYSDMIRVPIIHYCNLKSHMALIAQTSEYIASNISMISLDLSYNQLDGPIPTEFSTMQFLMVLYLEHNHLTGPLPQGLGHMKSLFKIDLSHNMLEGNIPPSLSDLSLSVLDLSNNQLSGAIPEQGCLITFPEYVFENNSGLCGLPLPPCKSNSTPNVDRALLSSMSDHQYFLIYWIVQGLIFSIFFITGFVIGQFL